MKRVDQKGFSAIEAVVILVIVSLIGFGGWYVWDKKQGDTNDSSYTVKKGEQTNSKSEETKEETYKVPEGYRLYEDKAVGFKFAYPDEWGALTFGAEENQRMVGHFANEQNFLIRLYQKTIGHLDTDSPTLNVYNYQEAGDAFTLLHADGRTTTIEKKNVLASSSKQGSSYLVYSDLGIEYYFVGMGKLEDSAKYDVVIFDYLRGGEDPMDKDDPNVQQMIKIIETFRG